MGVHLAWHGMTEESLEAAISEVLGDPGYQAAVARLRYNIVNHFCYDGHAHRQSHYIDGQSQLSHVCAACCPILSQTLGMW